MPSTPTSLTPSLHARLSTYATLAGAAIAAPALAPPASATVIYTPANISVPNTIDGVYLNVITGNTAVGNAGYDINPYNNGEGLTFFSAITGGIVANGTVAGTNQAISLALGAPISAAQTYLTGSALGTQFQVTGQEYIGFRFQNEGTGILNYGWLLIRTTASALPNGGFPATILGYAYENTGAAINAGQIPEPSTIALLGVMAAGAVGVRSWKRRRAA